MKKNYLLVVITVLFSVGIVNAQSKNYWSGEVRTKESYLYGRIEVRMKSADASGVTSTLFTYNTSSSIYNEIDIEIMGKDHNEVQYTTFTPDQSGVNYKQTVSFNPHAAFHVYAIEWTPDYVAWSVDGFEIHRDNSDRIQALFLPQAIMMNFWMPNSVDWAGTFNDSSLPLYAMYDWVKYYEYTPGVNNNFTLKWTDDFNTFDSNRWIKSSSTFGSNLCDFQPNNVLVKDGYLLLCMTKANQTASHASPIDDTDVDAPYPVNAWAFGDQMFVNFSEEVDQTSAEQISNYITLLTLSNPNLLPSKRKIMFDVKGASPDKTYPAAFIGIKDLSPAANTSALSKFNLQSAHSLPLVIDIGNDQSAGNGVLSEQKWDESKEYGSIGGTVKQESGVATAGEYASLCQNGLDGITFYRHRLRNGYYNVKLFFTETEKKNAGERVFDVYVNGNEKIHMLDFFKESGSASILEKDINGISIDDNMLEIYFKPETGFPILHGVVIEKDSTTSVNENGAVPKEMGLQSFPNPFNYSTNIRFTLPKQTVLNISVYDVLGRKCEELTSGRYDAGDHVIELDATKFSSGVYFVALSTPEMVLTKKIMYLK